MWGLVGTLGGSVSVDSTPGQGTTFSIRVPVAAVDVGGEDESVGDLPPATSLRILVVDDETRVLELVPPMLVGHRVDTAAHGGEGLARLAQADYDIVLSDWVMAEASGLEVAAEAKARNPDTVVVLMTGWDPGGTDSEHDAVDLHLAKPFEREDVERILQQAVALWQQRREAHAAAVPSVSS